MNRAEYRKNIVGDKRSSFHASAIARGRTFDENLRDDVMSKSYEDRLNVHNSRVKRTARHKRLLARQRAVI